MKPDVEMFLLSHIESNFSLRFGETQKYSSTMSSSPQPNAVSVAVMAELDQNST